MDMVINRQFGGFGLSVEAMKMYSELKGFNLYFYRMAYPRFNPNMVFTRLSGEPKPDDTYFLCASTIDLGDNPQAIPDDVYFSDSSIPRNDKDLVKVVRTLKEKANGSCANLRVAKIPADVKWVITQYDGLETVEEQHRSWR